MDDRIRELVEDLDDKLSDVEFYIVQAKDAVENLVNELDKD